MNGQLDIVYDALRINRPAVAAPVKTESTQQTKASRARAKRPAATATTPQLDLIEDALAKIKRHNDPQVDLDSYDRFVVFFSGGKDSVACVLRLLEWGVPSSKIEIHHHCVDGAPGEPSFMDYPVTEAYVTAFCDAFDLPLYLSWREGGFKREMLRDDALTAPIGYVSETGEVQHVGGTRGTKSTRRKFPQVAADLRVRWCSSSLKIDVGRAILNNEPRFREGKTLVITGERGEESPNRAKYAITEVHHSDNRTGKRVKRHIDHYRPVHHLTEAEVWGLLQKYGVQAHPCYSAGYSRASCINCIFGNPDQWATNRQIAPELFAPVAAYETEFGCTIHRTKDVTQQANEGSPYPSAAAHSGLLMATSYNQPILVDPSEWQLPAGAFKEGCGPV